MQEKGPRIIPKDGMAQLKLMLWKNFLLKKRRLVSSIMEVVLPVVLMSIILIGFYASGQYDNDYEETSWLVQTTQTESLDSYINNLVTGFFGGDINPRKWVAIAPNTPAIVDLISRIEAANPNFSLVHNTSLLFEDQDALLDYALNRELETDELWMAVIFSSTGSPESRRWSYTLRSNLSDVGYVFESLPDTRIWMEEYARVPPDWLDSADGATFNFDPYLSTGFVSLQQAIDKAIVEREAELAGNPITVNMDVTYTPFPTPDFTVTSFYDALGGIIGFFVTAAFIWPVSRLVKNIVEEKESKIKEGMKMMGLKGWVFALSWFLTYFIIFSITGLLVTMMMLPVFPNCDFMLILVSFLIFSYSVVGFCFLAAVFFDKSKMAAIVVPLIFLLMTAPENAFNGDDPSLTAMFFTGVLFSPTAFALGLRVLVTFETGNNGVNWVNLYQGVDEMGGYSFGISLWSLILSTFFYFFFAWYFELVLPHEYGTHLKPYFLFQASYWRDVFGASSRGNSSGSERQPLIPKSGGNFSSSSSSSSSSSATAGGLRQNQEAVNGIGVGQSIPAYVEPVSVDMADKVAVSLVNMRKVYDTTDGQKVAVEGLSMSLYFGQITALLGHNGAGKTTTFSILTGLYPPTSGDAIIAGHSVVDELDSIRTSMGVCPQHDILFDVLTVKEHLQLFAGLKGVHPNDVDKEVATKIKEVGLEEKTNVFSSSLSGGQKRKLSVAIALIGDSKIVFLDEPTSGMDPYSRRATWELLQKSKENRAIVLTTHFMDEADLLGDRIAIMAKGQLRCLGSSLFLKSRYGVGYHLTMTKEENIYQHDAFTKDVIRKHIKHANLLTNVGTEVSFQLPLAEVGNFASLFEQIENEGAKWGVTSFGISVTTMEEVFMRIGEQQDADIDEMASDKKKSLEISKRISTPQATTQVLERDVGQAEKGQLSKFERTKDVMTFSRHLRAMWYKRSIVGRRDKRTLLCQTFLPSLVVLGFFAILEFSTIKDAPSVLCSLTETEDAYEVPYGQNAFADAFVPCCVYDNTAYRSTLGADTLTSMDAYLYSTLGDDYSYTTPAAVVIDTDITDPVLTGTYTFNLFHNQSFFHMIPAIFSSVSTGILNNVTGAGSSGNPFVIQVSQQPFPFTDTERQVIDSIIAVTIAIFILIPFCFAPANYIIFIVKERENKAKHVQLVAGVNKYAYWLGCFFWDYISYSLCVAGTLLSMLIFDREEFVGSADAFFATLFVYLFYGVAIIPWVYCWSFAFKNPSSAQNMLLMINFLCGFVTVQANFILGIFKSTQPIADVLVYFFRLLPPFCLGEAITNLALVDLINLFEDGEKQNPLDWDVVGRDILCMFAHFFLFSAVLVYFENNETFLEKLLYGKQRESTEPRVLPDEDEDVKAERERVASGAADNEIIVLKNLRKVYPAQNNNLPKVAVHDLSIGIPSGECFGFLGVNGAGKTSTLSMLSGDFLPTSGDALLNQKSILTSIQEIRMELGYCPQFDALVELMTGEEHLQMYAMIKGIVEADKAVDSMLTHMDLQQYRKKAAGTYSGGNKRKLSVAIALMGNPKIVFLDEPSTGMDPVARRFMWDIIASSMVGRSVILTTHSMEECEALCSRIGIMVAGRLKCLGSAQHLKSRYGKGYQVEINAEPDASVTVIGDFMNSAFPGLRVLEQHSQQIRYDVPSTSLKLSTMFRLIESKKKELKIKEYGISQTSLEQVFIIKAKSEGEHHDH